MKTVLPRHVENAILKAAIYLFIFNMDSFYSSLSNGAIMDKLTDVIIHHQILHFNRL